MYATHCTMVIHSRAKQSMTIVEGKQPTMEANHLNIPHRIRSTVYHPGVGTYIFLLEKPLLTDTY